MNPIQKRADRVRSIALEQVLRRVDAQPDRHDHHKWHIRGEVLSVTGSRFMNWTRGIGGGGAIDLVIHLHQRGFMEALQWLEQHFAAPACSLHLDPLTRMPLKLPLSDPGKFGQVHDYLILNRALPARMIVFLLRSGRVYADANANAVFLLFGENNNPVGAELRGTTTASWRGMAPGSRKDLGYFAVGPPQATSVVLCESAIDAISCWVLYPQHRCISTAGARPHPGWLTALLEQNLEIYCGFDADPTGDTMAQAMIARHPSVQRMRPLRKDWNVLLSSA